MNQTPNRATSMWQAGCNDAKSGAAPNPPELAENKAARYVSRLARVSYINGFVFGCALAGREVPTAWAV